MQQHLSSGKLRATLNGSVVEFRAAGGYVPWEPRHEAAMASGAAWDKEARRYTIPVERAATFILQLKSRGIAVSGGPELRAAIETVVRHATKRKHLAFQAASNLPDDVKLYPHQMVGALWLAQRRSAILADDMGLGKTLEVIAQLPPTAMVVCPAVARSVWFRELQRCGRAAVDTDAPTWLWGSAVVTNVERIPEELDRLGETPERATLVVDEAHVYAGSKSQRAAKVNDLIGRVLASKGRVIAVTATPLLNDPMGLWSFLHLMRLTEESFGSWSVFVQAFRGRKLPTNEWVWGNPDHAVVAACLRRVMLRREKRDVLVLPEKTRTTRIVPFDGGVVEEAVASLGIMDDELLSKLERAVEVDDAEIALADWSRLRSALAVAKVPAALALVAELRARGDDPLVFTTSRDALRLFLQGTKESPERYGRWGEIHGTVSRAARDRAVDAYQGGELDGLALTIKAGGVAITATRANALVFIDREWTPALNEQAEDRAHRIGQTRAVRVFDVVSSHPVDERVAEVLTRKAKYARAVDSTKVTKLSEAASAVSDAAKLLNLPEP